MSPVRIRRYLPLHHEVQQLGIRQVEERFERLLFGGRGGRIAFPEVSFEQDIQFAHAAAAPPAKQGKVLAGH
jgi:hypothetical protein